MAKSRPSTTDDTTPSTEQDKLAGPEISLPFERPNPNSDEPTSPPVAEKSAALIDASKSGNPQSPDNCCGSNREVSDLSPTSHGPYRKKDGEDSQEGPSEHLEEGTQSDLKQEYEKLRSAHLHLSAQNEELARRNQGLLDENRDLRDSVRQHREPRLSLSQVLAKTSISSPQKEAASFVPRKDAEGALATQARHYKTELRVLQEQLLLLKEENTRLNTQVTKLIASENKRGVSEDPGLSPFGNGPDVLMNTWRNFKEQEFHSVASEVFRHALRENPSLKAERLREIARIKSLFTQHIFLNVSIEIERSTALEKARSLMDKLDALPISEESLLAIRRAVGKILAMEFPTNGHFPLDFDLDSHSIGHPFPNIALILSMVVRDLKFSLTLPDNTTDHLRQLIEGGVNIVQQIYTSRPPGTLWGAAEGELYDPQHHQVEIGCGESGKIVFTVFPGYRIGTMFNEKAVVYTTAVL